MVKPVFTIIETSTGVKLQWERMHLRKQSMRNGSTYILDNRSTEGIMMKLSRSRRLYTSIYDSITVTLVTVGITNNSLF